MFIFTCKLYNSTCILFERRYLNYKFRVIVLLITSGVSSSLERSILAVTQQRQSPSNTVMFGTLNAILDGLKLFSKCILINSIMSIVSISAVGLMLACPLFIDATLGCSLISSFLIRLSLFFWTICTILEIITIIITSGQSNHFVRLASIRFIEIFVMITITFEFLLIISFFSGIINTTNISSEVICMSICTLIICILGFSWLLYSEKVPFDVVEAESELIDGFFLDLPGIIFSIAFATEVVINLITIKLFCYDIGFSILSFNLYLFISYSGRILFPRIEYKEVQNLAYTIGLPISLLQLTII